MSHVASVSANAHSISQPREYRASPPNAGTETIWYRSKASNPQAANIRMITPEFVEFVKFISTAPTSHVRAGPLYLLLTTLVQLNDFVRKNLLSSRKMLLPGVVGQAPRVLPCRAAFTKC